MLTSLNVVRIAAVDCDCTRRSATRWRSRDIGTRCSGRSPDIRSTFAGEGNGAAGLGACGACSFTTTSSLVTRPPRPLPLICAVSRSLSAAIFLAEGMTAGGSAFADATGAAAGFSGALTADAAAAVVADAPAPATALPSVSIVAMTSSLTTVLPSPLMTLESTPESGAGSSSTTLSVSISIRFSSRLTSSPCFLCQDSNVASATDSESCGTLTSISMLFPIVNLDVVARIAHGSAGPLYRKNVVVDDFPEGGVDHFLLLLVVQ